MSASPPSRLFPSLPRRYRIERPLGEGSQKRVYLAEDTELARFVAISVLEPPAPRGFVTERLHEARAMARIGDHPHIVAIYDVIESPDRLYIVSRYLPGGDLEKLLAQRTARALDPPEVLRIGTELCLALEQAHANGISHCDLKPSNVFLDENGSALLGDFGFAEIGASASFSDGDQILGTPAYLAPEQITRNERQPSCDLYALGCLLYELTTGRPPFVAASPTDVLRLHQVARPTPPIARNPSIPAALSDLILKLLEKEPAARPGSARDVRAALAGIRDLGMAGRSPYQAGSTPIGSFEIALVARDEPMALLTRALERARDGTPGVLLVPGEPGIGKTRLLRELRRSAETRGCLVLLGQGYSEGSYPFRPFRELLSPLAGRLSELDPKRSEMLRNLLYLGTSGSSSELVTEREAQPHGLFVAVFAALAAFANPRPLVLILDDLHWADSASLDLFEHIAVAISRSTANLELVVIGSYRPPEHDSRLSQIIERISCETASELIELVPLNESAVFEVLSSYGIERPSGQLVHHVREVTGGNPLFIREVIDLLVRSGKLVRQHGFTVTSSTGDDLELPSSVMNAIAERASGLSAPAREVVTLASVLGAYFDDERIAEISNVSSDALREILDEAVSLGVLVDEHHRYRFAHPLVQQVMSQAASPAQRQRLHLRIAEHLLDSLQPDSPTADLELAFHLVRAGSLADPAELMRHASRAAEHALARNAWYEASELLEAAIAAGERAPDVPPSKLADLHRRAGLAYLYRYDAGPCSHHYDAALQAFQAAGDQLGLTRTLNDRVRAAVVLSITPYGDVSDMKALERALDRAPSSERALRAGVLSTLAESYRVGRQTKQAEQAGAEALELGIAIGDHSLCAEASISLGLTLYQSLRIDRALSCWREGRAHARLAENLFSEARCLQRVVLALLTSGRLAEAHHAALEVQEMNRTLQSPGESALTSSSLLALAALRGDLAEGERFGRDALDHVRRAKFPTAAIMTAPALACVRAMSGDSAGARAAIDVLTDPGVMFADSQIFEPMARDLRRLVDCMHGDSDHLDLTERTGLIELREGYDLAQLVDFCARVELADALQSPELAAGIAPILEVAEQEGVRFMTGWPYFLPRLRGVLALLEGNCDYAVAQLERALEIAAGAGARPEHARSSFDLARACATRNAGEDRVRARGIIESAIPQLRTYFPGAVMARAEKLSAFLGRDQEH